MGASSGDRTRVLRLQGETCNRSTTAAPFLQLRKLAAIYNLKSLKNEKENTNSTHLTLCLCSAENAPEYLDLLDPDYIRPVEVEERPSKNIYKNDSIFRRNQHDSH